MALLKIKSVRDYFTPEERERLTEAVKEMELKTSAEIRIHIERKCQGDPLDRAAYIFGKLGMHKTALRNGVLIYLAIENHQFAFIGDRGINAVVPPNFWTDLKLKAQKYFSEGQFTQGLLELLEEIGTYLQKFFPYKENDINELPDEISFKDKPSK